MKKTLLIMLIIITAANSVLAGDEKIKAGVLNAFKRKFPCAKEVSWQVDANHYKAAFNWNGYWLFAHYTTRGEWLGVTRHISSLQLPHYLQYSVKENYDHYWITNLVEESNDRSFNYYITLENANNRITLKSKHGSDWTLYSKQTKS